MIFALSYTIVSFYTSATWLLFCSSLAVIAFILCQGFHAQGRLLRRQKLSIADQVEQIPHLDMETERLRYETLLEALDIADQMFSSSLSADLIVAVLTVSLIIYNIVYNNGDSTLLTVDLAVTIMCCIILIIILIACILISWAVSQSSIISLIF